MKKRIVYFKREIRQNLPRKAVAKKGMFYSDDDDIAIKLFSSWHQRNSEAVL
jgi:hypothetical protein